MKISLIKYFLCVSLFFSIINISFGQTHKLNNEWIDYTKQYVKVPVKNTGIHRIMYNDLIFNNVPIGTAQKNTIKLFNMGKEIAFNDVFTGDVGTSYIEFWGTKNDGRIDRTLYASDTAQINKYYNLFSDVNYYFFTWGGAEGKRIIINNTPIAGNTITTHIKDTTFVFNRYYSSAGSIDEKLHASDYVSGEGWTSDRINGQSDFLINLKNRANGGVPFKVKYKLTGVNDRSHKIFVKYGKSKTQQISVDTLSSYGTKSLEGSFTITDENELDDSIYVSFVNSIAGSAYAVAWINIQYPEKANNTNNNTFFTQANTGNYLSFDKNKYSASIFYDISDSSNFQFLTPFSSDSIRVMLPNSSNNSRIWVQKSSSIIYLTEVFQVKMRNLLKNSSNQFVILYHPELAKPTNTVTNPVRAYASYRKSIIGGGYDTTTIDINEIYDQYSYGLLTPVSIRNYCIHTSLDTTTIPQYLFILGKAYDLSYSAYRTISDTLKDFRIPTYGFPGSDIKFSNELRNSKLAPLIATGRYSAINSADVVAYLDKVKSHESLSLNLPWRKNVVHLSGGGDNDQIEEFKSIVNNAKRTIEGPYIGAKVTSFSKSTTDIQVFNINTQLNNGLSIISFFGHSSPATSDIDIGMVSNPVFGYDNQGKYPLILMHGCKAGNPFNGISSDGYYSFGEDWLKTPNKGAVAFLGSTDYAFVDLLETNMRVFYGLSFADSNFYSKSIGKIHQAHINTFPGTNNERQKAHIEQWIIQGDPSIVMFAPTKPDYSISKDEIFVKSLDGKPITALSDSFALAIVVRNFGKVINEDIELSIDRIVDGQTISLPLYKVSPVANSDTIYYVFKTKDISTSGLNTFNLYINYGNQIDEVSYSNNAASFNYFIPKSNINCLLPLEYSVVNKQTTHLVAQSADLLSANRDYVFELDTSFKFNSPLYRTQTVNAAQTAIWDNVDLSQNIPSTTDSVVYFWRVKYKTLQAGELQFIAQSSFIFINSGSEGWSQAKFEQLYGNSYSGGIYQDTLSKKYKFQNNKIKLDVSTIGGSGTYKFTSIYLNDFPVVTNGACEFYGGEGILAIAFDKATLKPYTLLTDVLFRGVPLMTCKKSPVNKLVNLNPNFYDPNFDYKGFFGTYCDSVKDGDYVLLVSSGNAYYESWASGNYTPPYHKFLDKKVATLGCTKLGELKDGYPYIYFGQKGVGPIQELVPNLNSSTIPQNQVLNLNYTFESPSSQGEIMTPKIGPTSKWGNFYREFISEESPSTDDWSVDVIGYMQNGQQSLLMSDTMLADGFDLSKVVDALIYPYLSIKLNLKDKDNLSPAQVKRLQVLYEQVPEGIVNVNNPTKYINLKNVEEGETIDLDYNFKNISEVEFKSPFYVTYTWTNNNNLIQSKIDTLNQTLPKDSVFRFTKSFNTVGHVGNNSIQVYLNQKYQPEKVYDNNIWVLPFKVNADAQNPMLDVLFDGSRIANGDIVQPNPTISINVKDENKYLLKNDTIGMDILIKSCESCSFTKIPFTSPDIKVSYPTNTNNNQLTVQYLPKNLSDGRYTLRVQGADQTGNKAGKQPYQVEFEVINKSTVSNFYPYPNPFSNATRFVYTLTGNVVPDQVKIQIMTVTGKVVREITQDELGPLKIGSHATDFVWDGRDEFGDKLANGVYMYRVLLKSNGQDLEHRETAGDKAFKNNWGKLYILR